MVKNRKMWVQVLLVPLTLGLYCGYWYYETLSEMKYILKDDDVKPVLWSIFLILPLFNIYSYYKYSMTFSTISTEKLNKWILFILWLVFSPAVWFIVQKDLNTISTKGINQL